MWHGLSLDPLPDGFDWTFVAESYAHDIRKLVKSNPTLRELLDTALLEQSANLLARIAGPDPGFDLAGYREYLRNRCALLQLSAIHTSTYDRRVKLWNVFVPQSARESAPARDQPRELLRRLRQEGHVIKEYDDDKSDQLRQIYQNSPVNPILEILSQNHRTVVLGDPGSGKTSLLKFLVMRWVNQEPSTSDGLALPILIDLKEYAQERHGFLKYCASGSTTYGLDSGRLEKRLESGKAGLYLDGLEEIFDGPTRGLVIEEIAAFAAR